MTEPALNSDRCDFISYLVRGLAQELEEKIAQEYRDRERNIARRMYRKGYLAGRAAQRRGAIAVTNPERHARGTDRSLLND